METGRNCKMHKKISPTCVSSRDRERRRKIKNPIDLKHMFLEGLLQMVSKANGPVQGEIPEGKGEKKEKYWRSRFTLQARK